MPNFIASPAGINLEDGFISEAEILERFVGNQLWMWGNNTAYGMLGDGTVTSRSSPVQTVSGGTNWNKVSISGTFSAGIKSDGTLWTWGRNSYGELGQGTVTPDRRSSPVQTVSGGTNWKLIAAGGYTMSSIKTDGTLWTWGRNINGQLGDGTATNRSSPVQTVAGGTNWKDISSNASGIVALKTNGTLWTWGSNSDGQLGDGTITSKSSPVQTIAGGTNWKQVSLGGGTHSGAIKTDGTLWLWGHNGFGQLADTTIVHRSSPIQTIAGGTNWKQLTMASFLTGAIKTDGTLWCWGLNTSGSVGDGTSTNRSSPVQTISGGTNWKQVSVSNSTAAIKTDGTLWTWGVNTNGNLGDGTQTRRSSPVQTLSGGNNWKSVSAGTSVTGAITFAES